MSSMPTRAELKKNLKALKKRLEKNPMDLDARMRMARTHRLLSEKRRAVAHYGAVARYLSLAGQPLMAIGVLKELLQVDPRHEETLLFLAKLYARTAGAEPTNRGRVAVPIAEEAPPGHIALPEGLPGNATALWRAIRPLGTDVLAVHAPDEDGEVSIATELRELEPTLDIDEGDVVEERLATGDGEALELDPDDDFEILGPLTTEDIVLPKVPLFSSLSPEAFIELGHAMVFQRAQPGDVLFDEGQAGDSCIVIARGSARVTRRNDEGEDVELSRLEEGDFAGLFALLASETRLARLVAETHLEYFEIDRLAVERLVEKDPQAKGALAELFRERLLLNLLAVLPVFTGLSSEERAALAARFVDERHAADEEVLSPGDEHDGLWVLLEGSVRLSIADNEEGAGSAGENDGGPRLVPGDFFGSFAGTDGAKSDAWALALEPVVVAALPGDALAEVLQGHSDLSSVRDAFRREGLALTKHVFAGSGRLPGGFARLKIAPG